MHYMQLIIKLKLPLSSTLEAGVVAEVAALHIICSEFVPTPIN